MKRIALLLSFFFVIQIAAGTTIEDPLLTESSNHSGVYITVGAGTYDGPNDNDISVTPDYLILNETMMFNASGNVTLSSINQSNNTLNLTAYGAGGKLNFTVNLTNTSTKFFFKSDGTFIQTLITNSTGWLNGSRIISGTHIFTFGVRNITFSDQALSPSAATQYSGIAISLNVNDPDIGTISNVTAQVQKPGGATQNYSMTSGGGGLWSLTFTDTGTSGTYSVLSFNATDSSGVSYTTTSTMTFTISVGSVGGSPGGGGGGGGSLGVTETPSGNASVTETPIQVTGQMAPSGKVGGLVWWLALSLGSIMSVLSLSSRRASSNLLIVGLILAAYSAYMLQLIPPLTLSLSPGTGQGLLGGLKLAP